MFKMNFNKFLLASLPVFSLIITSCSKDEQVIKDYAPYATPATYTFNRNGVTTVDFNGQKSRILMLQEIADYVKTQGASGANVSDVKLLNMYANANTPFTNGELNSSKTKQLRDKTAASLDYFSSNSVEQAEERVFFENKLREVGSAGAGTATEGVAGIFEKRYYSANGLEPIQVVLKGLMGACFIDQICNNYLSTKKLDAGTNREDNTNKKLVVGTNYTEMEHAWDEAYGYVYGAGRDADGKNAKFWDSYIDQVNADKDFNTLKGDINLAFRLGRAAIVNNDYVTRDLQIAIIKEKLAKVAAVRAVYYLMEGKKNLVGGAAKTFHALSEGYGFIKCLRYTNKQGTNSPYLSKNEVDVILNKLMAGRNGFWDVDYSKNNLELLAKEIADKFGFTVEQAETVN
ncbi:DUF4856 domain-containing protein [Flavobacterium columnare NBRC 100251 = ATCC 23463]|uniref:DUF4856 domain-containing protein n=2 Tax=Flavobacterium columnare TaxID=996 RepID=G8X4J2_FLACA|nr:hypothetical protein FCOL_02860 [Flavobacterium columnare ATCC 49512]APT23174.1 DUF4856 domain-containing protein [Flavobacterium columnare]OOB83846.1 DUF4856 domain-containing protein [Flavobacterium columnare]PDS22055.1 DUF4856 domain-containing protein [Flavobacterium columnare NBRC 100251 = ATCC 23463]GEM56819.1 DUF4856 domain-containing protein [Flavobacterium columnare NBRC 100251 = ATCC 23463]